MTGDDERQIKFILSQVSSRQIAIEVALAILIRRLLKNADDPERELRSYLDEVSAETKKSIARLGADYTTMEPLIVNAIQEFVRLMTAPSQKPDGRKVN